MKAKDLPKYLTQDREIWHIGIKEVCLGSAENARLEENEKQPYFFYEKMNYGRITKIREEKEKITLETRHVYAEVGGFKKAKYTRTIEIRQQK